MVIVNFPSAAMIALLFAIAGLPALFLGYYVAPQRGAEVETYLLWSFAALVLSGAVVFCVFTGLEALFGDLERALRVGYVSTVFSSLAWLPCSLIGYSAGILRKRRLS